MTNDAREFFGDAESVRRLTGIRPPDLGITMPNGSGMSEEAMLDEYIERLLEVATEYIKQDRNRDYADEVPEGIKHLTERITANLIRFAIRYRTTPVTDMEDYEQAVRSEEVLTPDILTELSLYPRKPRYFIGVARRRDDGEA